MIVIRGSCCTWAEDSLPLPVTLSHATRAGPSTRNESMPFGDTFTRLSAVAVPTKNNFCVVMNSI
jgi:hypothetical protein